MSKSLSRKKRKPSTSSSDSDEVEWTERKSDSNKDLFDLIESNCSQNIKTIKMRKSEEKRDQELKDNRIRYERELNPLYRNDVNKTFVENPDFGSKEMSKEKSVSINSNLNKSKSKSISLTERNALNAKILKAEMFGNQQLVNELKNKLKQLEDNESNTNDNNEESNVREEYYSVEKKRNEESMSVKEMFFREKRTTVEDENRRFIASSSKTVRNPEDEYEDMRQKQKNRKFDIRNETKIRFHRSEDEEHNKCKQCITSIAKHLILANDENTVITLTPYKPFTYGYCCILSKSHSNVSTVSADEECLAQINQRKCEISKFFDKQNLSVIFMETYFKRKSFSSRHLVIECVPIKNKLESEAKIFFKKAILECEEEWAMNKKLVEINGKCVSKMIPKGLPYFWVTFGSKNNGFAHVIEDEEVFPQNFGKEIIGGLLDIEPNKWLKPKYENYDQQYERVISIKNLWNKTFS